MLADLLALVKGPHDRHVGRHTQRYCKNAAQRAANVQQKRMLMVSAIAADDLVSALLGFGTPKLLGQFQTRSPLPLRKVQITKSLKVVTSALLVLMGSYKEQLLTSTQFSEEQLLASWSRVFEYLPADSQIFDQELTPVFRQEGMAGLTAAVGDLLLATLFADPVPLSSTESTLLEEYLLNEAAAILSPMAHLG
jgi:hypothetical protein